MRDDMNQASSPGPEPAVPGNVEPSPAWPTSVPPAATPSPQPPPTWATDPGAAGAPAPESTPTWPTITPPVATASPVAASTAAAGPGPATSPASTGTSDWITPVAVQQRPRPSRARWVVAGLIALLIVAVSGVGLFTLVGASSTSNVAAWAPADSMLYVEARGDLPGDQRQNLGTFLAHFPGFADQSSLDAKLDEALDRLVAKASKDKHDWTKEIKPWFGGQVGVSASGTFAAGTKAPDTKNQHVLLVASQKDPAAAIAWLKSLDTQPVSEEPYQGVTLTVLDSKRDPPIAATATNGVLLVGDEPSVKSAIDRGGKDGLAASADFKTAMAGLSADQLTRIYVDLKSYAAALKSLAGSVTGGAALDSLPLTKVPDWMAGGMRVESDALASELVLPTVAGAPKVTDHESAIARHLPASTVAVLETHDLGTTLLAALPELRKQPGMAAQLDQIEQAAKVVGGLDAALEWIGDVGVVVTADGTTPGGGLVVVPSDQKKADAFSAQIKTLLQLAGLAGKVKVTDEPYGAGTITTIDAGDLSQLMGGASGASGTLGINGNLQISFTNQGGVVIIGLGPDWVKSIVDVKPGSSLADQARYRDAMARVGTSNSQSLFADITAARKLIEKVGGSTAGSNYTTDIKPYVTPFDVLAAATSSKDDLVTLKTVLTVTKPQ